MAIRRLVHVRHHEFGMSGAGIGQGQADGQTLMLGLRIDRAQHQRPPQLTDKDQWDVRRRRGGVGMTIGFLYPQPVCGQEREP